MRLKHNKGSFLLHILQYFAFFKETKRKKVHTVQSIYSEANIRGHIWHKIPRESVRFSQN